MKNIAVFGAFDTKGAEFTYLLECMRGLAPECKIITIDVSARTHDAEWAPDVSCEEVARMGGGDLQELAKGDRLEAVTVMIKGAKKCLRSLYDEGKLAGAITLGGGTGTVLGMQVLHQLPIGLPKILVSTIAASATTGRMWQGSDILVMNSVVDIAGLNRISRAVFRTAAGAIVGAVQAGELPLPHEDKPVVAATMYGMTTPGVEAAKALLEREGCEVLVFHANGAGGGSSAIGTPACSARAERTRRHSAAAESTACCHNGSAGKRTPSPGLLRNSSAACARQVSACCTLCCRYQSVTVSARIGSMRTNRSPCSAKKQRSDSMSR